jgi:hypothetical protein
MARKKRTALDLLQPTETKVEYLDPSFIVDKRESEPPP